MAKPFLLLLILVQVNEVFSQKRDSRLDLKGIIENHLKLTSQNKSWSDLQSFSERGLMEYPEGKTVKFNFMAKWPGKSMIDLVEPSMHRTIYETEDGTTVIENGSESSYGSNLMPIQPMYSKYNYSFALSKCGDANLKCSYKGDTAIDNTIYHQISFKEKGVHIEMILLVEPHSYKVIFAQSNSAQYNSMVHFEDFKWVDGYLCPFKSSHYKNGRLFFVKTIEHLSINSLKDLDFYR